MPDRRLLSLWFPRLGAERLLRLRQGPADHPFAVTGERGGVQLLTSLSAAAEAVGLARFQRLRDARALCPELATAPENAPADAAFLAALRRWAGRFSPWIAEEPPEALLLDLTGCAHLFGGEAGLLRRVAADCAALQLTVRPGIADTPGAAWGLARFATDAARVAAPGQTRQALASLPLAALRLDDTTVASLGRLGLRRVEDLANQPRAGLARRFGRTLMQRLDQALGIEAEPLSPAPPEEHFATRLSLPDPIGLEDDLLAAIDRLLPPLCEKLGRKGRGVRQLQLVCLRADGSAHCETIGLARAAQHPDALRPLLALKLPGIEAGFGIDAVRLVAAATEPVAPRQRRSVPMRGGSPLDAGDGGAALADLIGRLGTRIGLEAITRHHPADSHIPEKTALVLAAAWSGPAEGWPARPTPRPLSLWRPEPVQAPESPRLPARFRWRGRDFATAAAAGPERIAPEWWLDEPEWRSGLRDYWRVTAESGDRLWLFYAHGAALSPGWFCQGSFG